MNLYSSTFLAYAILNYGIDCAHIAQIFWGGYLMESNLINVNPQMQKLAENAVTTARDKFGVSLDFTENSLQQLEMLLQQAHEGYKQTSSTGNISVENTVQVWGSYLGEVIRRSLGGNWIVDQKDVFLQLNSKRLDPLGQVRSRIMMGTQYGLKESKRLL